MKKTIDIALPHPLGRSSQLGCFSLAIFLILLAVSTPARCGTILVMIVENAAVSPGGISSLDILLANDAIATDGVTIAGFSIDLMVAAVSGITFTGADDATSTTYIFAGNSLGFLPTVTPTEVQANDFAAISDTLLAPRGPPGRTGPYHLRRRSRHFPGSHCRKPDRLSGRNLALRYRWKKPGFHDH